ncbi:MAG: chalcone isomerase family protein [Sulfurisoma sp.]|nr:chalcone isomerase family protein [Sulfurisoma sp.]
MMRRLILLVLACGLAGIAQATEVAGVKFEDGVRLGNAELVLNGAGLRSRVFFKVYAIGLYLPGKKAAAADVLAAAGAKRLRIVTLRELTAEQFADALVEGIHKNHADAEIEPLKARIEKFRGIVLDIKTAPKGAVVEIDWLPEVGTRLSFAGERRGEDIPGEDFHRALLRIWLGEKPAQDDLKDALLGK